MAHKKAGGSTSLGRDSQSKRLGVKKFDGQYILPGGILVKQSGMKIRAGKNVSTGKDDTLFATAKGFVKFIKKRTTKFNGKTKQTSFATVIEDTK